MTARDEARAALARWDEPGRPEGWNYGDEHHLANVVIDSLRALLDEPIAADEVQVARLMLALNASGREGRTVILDGTVDGSPVSVTVQPGKRVRPLTDDESQDAGSNQ